MLTEILSAGNTGGRSEVLSALRDASAKTGSDFDYLLATARRESSLDSHAKSKTSSATGLFQFIDQTWLGLVKRFGEKHGLGAYAGAITETGKGRFQVASSEAKAAILALRQNPALSALMAGESANETRQSLQCVLGREVCSGELYAAHFLGPNGARQLIQMNERDPNMRADIAFPQAAQANRGVFYRADGTAKTIGEVYAWAVSVPGEGGVKTPPASAPRQNAPVAVAAAAPEISPATRPIDIKGTEKTKLESAAALAAGEPATRRVYPHWDMDGNAQAPISPRSLPQSPLLLTPGVMEILAAFTPANLRRAS